MASNKFPHIKKRAFLKAYSENGNIAQSAEITEIDRSTHYDWLNTDPDYKTAFIEAGEQAAERLEQEARRRAVDGVEKPVYQGGKKVGTVKEYSDTLLIFMLKGIKPEKYKDRVYNEHTGADGGPIQIVSAIPRPALGDDD